MLMRFYFKGGAYEKGCSAAVGVVFVLLFHLQVHVHAQPLPQRSGLRVQRRFQDQIARKIVPETEVLSPFRLKRVNDVSAKNKRPAVE